MQVTIDWLAAGQAGVEQVPLAEGQLPPGMEYTIRTPPNTPLTHP